MWFINVVLFAILLYLWALLSVPEKLSVYREHPDQWVGIPIDKGIVD